MRPFPQPLVSRAAPLILDNIDTDTIIPSREMRSTGRTGLADGLFAPWRYEEADARVEKRDFVLNLAEFRDASILLGGANFGCGSSREHAVWALVEWGVRCIIAVGFAPIFRGNCIRNGLLPVTLAREAVAALAGAEVSVDLAAQVLAGAGTRHEFAIDPEAKQMLLEGRDAIDMTLAQAGEIAAWTAADRAARPWVYLEHGR